MNENKISMFSYSKITDETKRQKLARTRTYWHTVLWRFNNTVCIQTNTAWALAEWKPNIVIFKQCILLVQRVSIIAMLMSQAERYCRKLFLPMLSPTLTCPWGSSVKAWSNALAQNWQHWLLSIHSGLELGRLIPWDMEGPLRPCRSPRHDGVKL